MAEQTRIKKNIIWNDDTCIYIYISTFLLQLIIYYCKIKQIKKSFLQPVNGHWVLHISCTKNLNLKESALCQNTWTYVEPYIISAFQFKTIVNDQHVFLWIIGSPMLPHTTPEDCDFNELNLHYLKLLSLKLQFF